MKEKMFNHVAVTINDPADIRNFYEDILGLEVKYRFNLPKTITNKIFKIEKDVEIVNASGGDFTIELFITDDNNCRDFQHTCINVEDREEVIRKAREGNYSCSIIKRDKGYLVFIRDKSNNLFEIKQ